MLRTIIATLLVLPLSLPATAQEALAGQPMTAASRKAAMGQHIVPHVHRCSVVHVQAVNDAPMLLVHLVGGGSAAPAATVKPKGSVHLPESADLNGDGKADRSAPPPVGGAGASTTIAFDIGPPGADGVTPTASAHAINTQGTASNFRGAAPPRTACTQVAIEELGFPPPKTSPWISAGDVDGDGVPEFRVALTIGGPLALAPAIVAVERGRAARPGPVRFLIVPSGTRPDLPTLATSSAGGGVVTGWDLKKNTKI